MRCNLREQQLALARWNQHKVGLNWPEVSGIFHLRLSDQHQHFLLSVQLRVQRHCTVTAVEQLFKSEAVERRGGDLELRANKG